MRALQGSNLALPSYTLHCTRVAHADMLKRRNAGLAGLVRGAFSACKHVSTASGDKNVIALIVSSTPSAYPITLAATVRKEGHVCMWCYFHCHMESSLLLWQQSVTCWHSAVWHICSAAEACSAHQLQLIVEAVEVVRHVLRAMTLMAMAKP